MVRTQERSEGAYSTVHVPRTPACPVRPPPSSLTHTETFPDPRSPWQSEDCFLSWSALWVASPTKYNDVPTPLYVNETLFRKVFPDESR